MRTISLKKIDTINKGIAKRNSRISALLSDAEKGSEERATKAVASVSGSESIELYKKFVSSNIMKSHLGKTGLTKAGKEKVRKTMLAMDAQERKYSEKYELTNLVSKSFYISMKELKANSYNTQNLPFELESVIYFPSSSKYAAVDYVVVSLEFFHLWVGCKIQARKEREIQAKKLAEKRAKIKLLEERFIDYLEKNDIEHSRRIAGTKTVYIEAGFHTYRFADHAQGKNHTRYNEYGESFDVHYSATPVRNNKELEAAIHECSLYVKAVEGIAV